MADEYVCYPVTNLTVESQIQIEHGGGGVGDEKSRSGPDDVSGFFTNTLLKLNSNN